MWIPICDECKKQDVVFGKIDDDKHVWNIEHKDIQNSRWHACSKECAIAVDTKTKEA